MVQVHGWFAENFVNLFVFVAGVLWLLILNLNLGIGMDFHFVRLSALPYERKTHN